MLKLVVHKITVRLQYVIQFMALSSTQKKSPKYVSRTSILPKSEQSVRCVIVNVWGVEGGEEESYHIDPCELKGENVRQASRPHIFRVISAKCTPFLGCSEPTRTATTMHRVIFTFALPSLFYMTVSQAERASWGR